MAHGENANRWHQGREYWSKRAGVQSWGTIGKQITHERERMQNKKIIKQEVENVPTDRPEKE